MLPMLQISIDIIILTIKHLVAVESTKRNPVFEFLFVTKCYKQLFVGYSLRRLEICFPYRGTWVVCPSSLSVLLAAPDMSLRTSTILNTVLNILFI